jgi:hypothetical protein
LHNGSFPLPKITLREPKLKIGPIYRASLLRKTHHKIYSDTLFPAHRSSFNNLKHTMLSICTAHVNNKELSIFPTPVFSEQNRNYFVTYQSTCICKWKAMCCCGIGT